MALAVDGRNQCQIARETGIPRSTVRDWLCGPDPKRTTRQDRPGSPCPGCDIQLELVEPVFADYSYLLGLYLGDGCLSAHERGVFRLRIILDQRYPGIVDCCVRAVERVVPDSLASIYPHPWQNAVQVSSYSKHWPCLLPQHGPGKKHDRPIILTGWQREIVDRRPWCFLRGLIHSDGSRFMNPSIHPHRTYWYPRYNFTNHSEHIRDLFCEYCDEVGVRWRQMKRWNISVARRDSVALMDRFIGPKR